MAADIPAPMTSNSDPSRQRQLDLLRIVCCVAWADGDVSDHERQLLERLVAQYFPQPQEEEGESILTAARQLAAWAQELSALEELVPRLTIPEDRLLALKLSYLMARIDRQAPEESSINAQEKRAYRRLVELCALPEEDVREAEWAAERELGERRSPWDQLSDAFSSLGAWPSPETLGRLNVGWF
jgi:uncharacterized tellurite resistance protein B-like protein